MRNHRTPFVADLCAIFRSFGTNDPFVNKNHTIYGDQLLTGFRRLGAKFSHANVILKSFVL